VPAPSSGQVVSSWPMTQIARRRMPRTHRARVVVSAGNDTGVERGLPFLWNHPIEILRG